jgi:hypothetical protein
LNEADEFLTDVEREKVPLDIEAQLRSDSENEEEEEVKGEDEGNEPAENIEYF